MSPPAALVLMYHHIADPCADPGGLNVSAENLGQQLDVLRKEWRPTSLKDLRTRLLIGDVVPRSVVVTLDDGYRDNLQRAKPLLEYHDVPATVFVAAGRSDQRTPFWWDELERLLLHPGTLPVHLQLRVGDRLLEHELGDAAAYTDNEARQLRDWRAWHDPPTPRHALYVALREVLVSRRDDEQRALMRDLFAWAGTRANKVADHQRLTDDEIVSLAQGNVIEVGAHTVNHPMLSRLTSAQQSDEILESKSHLEDLLNASVESFAYPYGDYSRETIGIVRELGFACAASIVIGPVRQHSDPFQLPRCHVGDMNGDEFSGWLREMWSLE